MLLAEATIDGGAIMWWLYSFRFKSSRAKHCGEEAILAAFFFC